MKSFLKITSIIIFSAFFLASCDNEPLSEDIDLSNPSLPGGVDVSEESILGTWEVSDQILDITIDVTASFGGETLGSNQNLNFDQESGDVTITFTDNGEFTSQGMASLVVTGEQDGVAIPESTETAGSPFSSGTWSVSSGILTLTNSDATIDFSVISFSGNTMNLFSNEELPSYSTILQLGDIPDITDIFSQFEDFPDFNFDVEQSFEAEYILTKSE